MTEGMWLSRTDSSTRGWNRPEDSQTCHVSQGIHQVGRENTSDMLYHAKPRTDYYRYDVEISLSDPPKLNELCELVNTGTTPNGNAAG